MELIDRQAAIDAIENAFDRETILNRFVRKIAISAVKLLPSVQPERKTGRWIYNSYGNGLGNWHCSACGKISLVNGDEGYCPHCGAEMEEL